MPTYETLSHRHQEYSEKVLCELQDLFAGGYRMLAQAAKYLHRLPCESDASHETRLKIGYLNFLAGIVGHYSSRLFEAGIHVVPPPDAANPATPGTSPVPEYYEAFGRDADRCGNPFETILSEAIEEALVYQRAYLCVDMPSLSATPTSRADDEIEPYLYSIPIEQVINWKIGENGKFEWVVLEYAIANQDDPLVVPTTYALGWKVWKLVDGHAEWDAYRSRDLNVNCRLDKNESIARVDHGVTDFSEIPILLLKLPNKLWIGNKVGPLCLEHHQRRSALSMSASKSCVSIPAVFLGSEMPQPSKMVSEVQQDPGRGNRSPVNEFERRGFTTFGSDDRLEFVSPDTAGYEFVKSDLEALRVDIYRTVWQMAQSLGDSSSRTRNSGESKREDGKPEVKMLKALATYVRKFAVQIYTLIDTVRGGDTKWVVHGLDGYEDEDRDTLLSEAQALGNIPIPSPTFQQLYKFDVARKLCAMDAQTSEIVRQEIVDGVVAEATIAAQVH